MRPGKLRIRALLLVSLVLLFGSGCKASIGVQVLVDADGSGEISIGVQVDAAAENALRELTGRGFAESYALSDVVAAGWNLERRNSADGGSGIDVSRHFDSPTDAGPMLDSIAGFYPVIIEDLQIRRSDGLVRVNFDFSVTVDLGSRTLSDTLAAAIGKDEVSALARRYGLSTTDSVSAHVRVVLPGSIRSGNSDGIDGGGLVWSVAGGSRVRLEASSAYFQWPYVVGAAVGATALVGLVVLLGGDLRRNRRNRRNAAAHRALDVRGEPVSR